MGMRRYAEWAAPAALADAVACLWSAISWTDTETLVVPDACSDLIWEQGRGAFVAGPDTGPSPSAARAGTVLLGVRFRPSAGGPALGLPLSELRDQRVDLAQVRPADARRLPGTLDLKVAATRLVNLAGTLVADRPPDAALTHATRLLADPRVRAEDVADQVGLSPRQLRRRCHDSVGYGPKTLQRVLRFRQFVSRIDARDHDARDHDARDQDLAAIAADTGYADQAHLTRECARLAGVTPAALARLRADG